MMTKIGVVVIQKGVSQFLRIVVGILFAILLAAGALTWRLDQGPVMLDALTPYLEDALSDPQANVRVSIEHTELRWDHGLGSVGLRLQGTRVRDNQERLVARFPGLGITVEPWWLLQGRIYPRMIRIINPRILMIRDKNGQIRLGMSDLPDNPVPLPEEQGHTEPESTATETTTDFVQEILASLTNHGSPDGTPGSVVLSHLSLLQISDASMVVIDRIAGMTWHIPQASADMTRTRGQLDFDADLELATSQDTTHLDLTGSYSARSRHLEFRLETRDLRPSILSDLSGALSPLAGLDIPLSGTIEARLALGEQTALVSGAAHITGKSGILHLPEPIKGDIPVKSLEIGLKTTADLQDIQLETLILDLDGTIVTAQGHLQSGTGGTTPPSGQVTVSVDALPVNRLRDLWPAALAVNPRTWITENLEDGTVRNGSWTFDLGADEHNTIMLKALSGTAQAEGVTVHYLRPMPPVSDTHATISFTGDTVGIAVQSGYSGALKVTGGTIALEKLDQDDNTAAVNLSITGPLPEALALIDNKPLGYARKIGIVPDKTAGHVETELKLLFPLLSDLPLDQLSVHANVQAKDVSIANLVFNQNLEKTRITMAVTTQNLEAKGEGMIGGIPARFTWTENFSGTPFASRYLVDATIAQDKRPVVGLTFTPFDGEWIEGPITAKADMTTQSDGHATLNVDADLTAAHAAIPELGWVKPTGKPGHAKATLLLRGQNVTEVPSFSASVAPDLTIRGSLNIGRNSTLADLRLDTVRINGTDAKVRIRPAKDSDGLNVTVTGSTLDLSPLFSSQDDSEGNSKKEPDRTSSMADDAPLPEGIPTTPPTVTHLDFAKVLMSEHGGLEDLKVSAARRNGRFESVQATARVDEGKPAEFRITPSGEQDGRNMTLRTSDAGALARALGIITTMRGGELQVNGTLSRHGVARGTATVGQYRLVDAPLLARILSVAALTGILDTLRGEGIGFESLEAPFVYDSDRNRLTLNDFRTHGASLGMTGRGTVWFSEGQIDVAGSIIPAYALNSLVGKIPLIGQILTGFEKDGGLIGANYAIRGTTSEPSISVNPLSALAPGFLRRLFNLGQGSTANEAEPQPAPSP